jgi:aspartate/methionine/tyrosine aminotransferase
MSSTPSGKVFLLELQRVRASGRRLLDLTEWDPARCGLSWAAAELGQLPADLRAAEAAPEPPGLREARDAIASYLAGRGADVEPDRILITQSAREAYRSLFRLLCQPGDVVLVPSPNHPLLDSLAPPESVRLERYQLKYDGDWHVDRKALRRAVTARARAIVAASPASPTGALLGREELAFLEDLCAARGIALIGDEALADTALGPAPSVMGASRCLSFHISGLSTVCGLPHSASWIAVAGPELLVSRALLRLAALAGTRSRVSHAVQFAIPALLARRAQFLALLQHRLSGNRVYLSTAALREAPWAPLSSGGGWSVVLEIGGAWDEEALCLKLLEDGVVLRPGFLDGFDRNGYLVLSLLPDPATFSEAVDRLERRLREPASPTV